MLQFPSDISVKLCHCWTYLPLESFTGLCLIMLWFCRYLGTPLKAQSLRLALRGEVDRFWFRSSTDRDNQGKKEIPGILFHHCWERCDTTPKSLVKYINRKYIKSILERNFTGSLSGEKICLWKIPLLLVKYLVTWMTDILNVLSFHQMENFCLKLCYEISFIAIAINRWHWTPGCDTERFAPGAWELFTNWLGFCFVSEYSTKTPPDDGVLKFE